VDASVLDGQRAYGAYLRAAGGPGHADLLRSARSAYGSILEAAIDGDPSSQAECARLLREPQTLADLGFDVVDVMAACEPDQLPAILRTAPSASDVLRLAARYKVLGRSLTAFLAPFENYGLSTGDHSPLQWMVAEGDPYCAAEAVARWGRLLVRRAAQPQDAGRGSRNESFDRLIAELRLWLDMQSPRADRALVGDATRALAWLESREGFWRAQHYLGVYRALCSSPVPDLATWLRDLAHLDRAVGVWLTMNEHVAELSTQRQQLLDTRAWFQAHARSWGQSHTAPVGFAPGQVLPPPPGSCWCCASPLRGEPYCRQCGSRTDG
jgi:hypothetical protein